MKLHRAENQAQQECFPLLSILRVHPCPKAGLGGDEANSVGIIKPTNATDLIFNTMEFTILCFRY